MASSTGLFLFYYFLIGGIGATGFAIWAGCRECPTRNIEAVALTGAAIIYGWPVVLVGLSFIGVVFITHYVYRKFR